MKQYILNIL